jgi:hypothetical protein
MENKGKWSDWIVHDILNEIWDEIHADVDLSRSKYPVGPARREAQAMMRRDRLEAARLFGRCERGGLTADEYIAGFDALGLIAIRPVMHLPFDDYDVTLVYVGREHEYVQAIGRSLEACLAARGLPIDKPGAGARYAPGSVPGDP